MHAERIPSAGPPVPRLRPATPDLPGLRRDAEQLRAVPQSPGTAMSAVTAAAPARAARGTAHTEREVLTRIARGGLLICETELRYQLQRRGMDLGSLPGLLADLQHRGLIESETHYRLTAAGAALVPAGGDRPAPRALSSIPWSSPPTPARGPRAPRPPTAGDRPPPGTPAARTRASRPTR